MGLLFCGVGARAPDGETPKERDNIRVVVLFRLVRDHCFVVWELVLQIEKHLNR